jgi:hypothetical protein
MPPYARRCRLPFPASANAQRTRMRDSQQLVIRSSVQNRADPGCDFVVILNFAARCSIEWPFNSGTSCSFLTSTCATT